jgi:hypothetical protein
MTQARDLADNKLTGDVEIDGTTLTVDSTNNRVGMGTDSPNVFSTLIPVTTKSFLESGYYWLQCRSIITSWR